MEMVIGGAFQGKAAFAEKMYPGISWVKGNEISREELFSARGVVGFHEFIKKEMEQGSSVEALAEELIRKNPEVILVSDEVGYGVVPVDAFRELTGRLWEEHVQNLLPSAER